MVGKVLVGTGDGRLTACEFLCFKVDAVGGENELRLCLDGCRTVLERAKRLRYVSSVSGQDMNVVGLENATEVGLVGCARAQPLDSGVLVAE